MLGNPPAKAPSRHSTLLRHAETIPPYAIAVLSVVLAMLLKHAIAPVDADRSFSPFLFLGTAVTLSAWYGGQRPGFVSLLLGSLFTAYLYLEPTGAAMIRRTADWYRLLGFLVEGTVICLVCGALHRARRRAEAMTEEARLALGARRSSESRFRRLAESDVIGILAGRDESINEANDAFLRILGMPRERLRDVGLSIDQITPKEHRERDEQAFAELFRVGSVAPFEKEYIAEDGRRVPVLVGGALVEPGTPDWVAFVLDLTERKRVERALVAATALAEDANRSKSEFLAVISHELITPMNAILGMNRLALSAERDPTLRGYLHTAQESAEALLALLSDLLDFSSFEAGGFGLEGSPFPLRPTIDQVVRPMAVRAARKGLELASEVDDAVPDGLIGDPRRLRQVLVNLLDNALKFTRRGAVNVRVGVERLEGQEALLRFEVADTGIGIAPEDRERIFAPFTQIDASNTRPYSGTGLGLSICRQIIGLMGGAVEVSGKPGLGSRFVFNARFGVQSGAELAPDAEAAGLRGLRALIVDDDPASRRALESTLGGWSMRSNAAPDGPTALGLLAEAAAAGRRYGLVVLQGPAAVEDGGALALRVRREGLAEAIVLSIDPEAGAVPEGLIEIAATVERSCPPSALLEAVTRARVLGRGTPSFPRLQRQARRSLHILLAEDTAANQRLATALLRRRGHRVDLAVNGREAVELAGRHRYDLVLMDVQMPVMDGLQATAAIRRLGRGSEVPIVALTAHAARGDRERCLSARMDGYIPKPINTDSFFRVVEAFVPNGDDIEDGDPPAIEDPGPGDVADGPDVMIYDRRSALGRMGDDEGLFRDMVRFFLSDFPELLDQLRHGLLDDDASAVERSSHSLRGLTANCGSGPASEAADRVETIGRERRLADAPEAVEHLVGELHRLRDALAFELDDAEDLPEPTSDPS